MKKIFFVLFLLAPLFAFSNVLDIVVDMPLPDYDLTSNTFVQAKDTYGRISAPGKWQLPVKTINVLLPPGSEVQDWDVRLSSVQAISAPEPILNPAFSSSENTLSSNPSRATNSQVRYRGIQRWGDIHFVSFDILPAVYEANQRAYLWSELASIQIKYAIKASDIRRYIPKTMTNTSFFANSRDLAKWYYQAPTRNYDYLIVSTPDLYAAAAELVSYRNSQGLIVEFADISDILATSPGMNNAEKLRNYLVQEYDTHPFTYLLLIGDIGTIPIAMLTPEPDGSDTVPSDFYYSDLSSNFDTDNDGRLGEYSMGIGDQDWGMDFTPEVFVGRIAWDTASAVSSISQRIVAFEQSNAPWKNKALLPAAFLNYAQEEWNMDFAQTDGAGFMELIKSTVIRNMQSTTLYEQLGVVPSFPSDYALDYNTLISLLNTESFGLLNWSAHGSATSSSRKVWMDDSNNNAIPDAWEMQWLSMINRDSFNNLGNSDGMVVFCASCYNGKIDHTSASLAEQVLLKKGVAVIGATRTGWYKIGWENPGWGGLSSYNYHLLENYIANGMSIGAAHSYANLLHTQYYLFGDPIDSDGIIWPELQNVYTYLMFGDPAVGYTPTATEPLGEILVWEPHHSNGIAVVNAINDLGGFNVIYTDKLIPDYEYIDNFDAVFCLLGFGDTAFILSPGSLEYNLLNSYLDNGGRMYLEGAISWDETDSLIGKFGTIAPYDHLAFIERVRFQRDDTIMLWDYDSPMNVTQALCPYGNSAIPLFSSQNEDIQNDVIAVYNSNGNYRTIGSSFNLFGVCEPDFSLMDMITVIFDTLNVGFTNPVSNHDSHITPAQIGLNSYPNPFSKSLKLEVKGTGRMELEIFNLRGQIVHAQKLDHTGTKAEYHWEARDSKGRKVPSGVYFIRLKQGQSTIVKKAMLIR